MQSSSLLTLIPYIAMVLMTPFVGPVADGLVKKGWKLTNVRKLAQVKLAIPEMFESPAVRKTGETHKLISSILSLSRTPLHFRLELLR